MRPHLKPKNGHFKSSKCLSEICLRSKKPINIYLLLLVHKTSSFLSPKNKELWKKLEELNVNENIEEFTNRRNDFLGKRIG